MYPRVPNNVSPRSQARSAMTAMQPESAPTTSESASYRWRRVGVVGALLAFYLASAWLLHGAFQDRLKLPPWEWLPAVGIGGSALLGLWAALGPSALWIRLSNSLLLLLSVVAIFFWSTTDSESQMFIGLSRVLVFSFHISSYLASLMTFALLRWLRSWRLVLVDAPATTGPGQFPLRLLFVEILLAAVGMALLRMAPSRYWSDLWDAQLLVVVAFVTLVMIAVQAPLVPLVAVLLRRSRPTVLQLVVTGTIEAGLLFAAMGLVVVLNDTPEELGFILSRMSAAFVGAAIMLALLRLAGYRLESRGW